MKKNKQYVPEARTSPNYLNFIRRNQQIVDEFRQLSKIQNNLKHPKRNTSTVIDHKSTLETDRYAGNNLNIYEGFKRISTRKQSPMNEFSFESDIRLQGSHELPINGRKAYLSLHAQPGKVGLYTRNLSIPSSMDFAKNSEKQDDSLSKIKFPKIQKTNKSQQLESNEQADLLEQQILQIEKVKHIKKQKYKYVPISTSKIKIQDEELRGYTSKTKMKGSKIFQSEKGKINTKLVRTYYDYENVMELKNKPDDLLPSFKPLHPKKKEKIQILQLSPNAHGELEKYLETSKAKKYIRKSGAEKIKKDAETQIKEIPEEEERMQESVKKEKAISKLENGKNRSSISSIVKKKQKKEPLLFKNHVPEESMYKNKIQSYRQFLFLVNFAHRIFDPLILTDNSDKYKAENKYKYYIGKGNNSMLIKSLMKRRFWWTAVDDPKEANFVWTQLKINFYYQFQKKSKLEEKYDKLDEYFEESPEKLKKNKSLKKKISIKKEELPQKKITGIVRGILPNNEKKIFTKADNHYYKEMLDAASENPEKLNKFQYRFKLLPEELLRIPDEQYSNRRVHNHFLQNFFIGNKKALFYNLKRYYDLLEKDVFKIIPLTYHIKTGVTDPEYSNFLKEFKRIKGELQKAEKSNSPTKKLSKNIWIVKPGQLSNRGNGITVIDEIYQLNTILKTKTKHMNGTDKTYIVQKYIERPLLYKNRKFDIRHFMMMSRLHGRLRAYWFSEGYIRTSSYEYSIEQVGDEMIHLTNDAIQKGNPNYGKYEEGNKISYSEFQRYLDTTLSEKKVSFVETIYPKMKAIATDAIKATYLEIDPDEAEHNFEIFGLDFMIDSSFNVWLIQVNTNPCLQLSSNLLNRIIPTFIENSFRLALDPIFPPTAHFINSIKYLTPDNPMERLQFELIFDEGRDGKQIQELYRNAKKLDCGQIDEEDETYDNEGKEIDLGGDLD